MQKLREEQSCLRQENLRLTEEVLRLRHSVAGAQPQLSKYQPPAMQQQGISVSFLVMGLAMAIIGVIIGKFVFWAKGRVPLPTSVQTITKTRWLLTFHFLTFIYNHAFLQRICNKILCVALTSFWRYSWFQISTLTYLVFIKGSSFDIIISMSLPSCILRDTSTVGTLFSFCGVLTRARINLEFSVKKPHVKTPTFCVAATLIRFLTYHVFATSFRVLGHVVCC